RSARCGDWNARCGRQLRRDPESQHGRRRRDVAHRRTPGPGACAERRAGADGATREGTAQSVHRHLCAARDADPARARRRVDHAPLSHSPRTAQSSFHQDTGHTMIARLGLASLFAAAMATALGAQQQRFRAGVELVSLNVTVTDGTGRYVTDLAQEDFEVYEDGARQGLTFFSRTQQPISLALLLDTSASMEERMPIAQEAAVGCARQLHKEDQAAIIDFDSQVRILAPFTSDGAALEQAIRATTANGST